MNLLETLLNANDGATVREMARSLGLGEEATRDAVSNLAPALSRGIRRNAEQPGGIDALLGALKSGNHRRYLDEPERLGQPETIADGDSILGHILGSKDVSRNVAGRAAQQTGLDAGLLKKLLPMVATVAMGSMSREASGGGILSQLGGGGGADSGLAGVLEGFLDSDRDGAVVDDLLSLAKKFF